ncbi:MAG: hypothetical protein IJ405_01380 [Lachnospiraceae bacterium]|nr:hypothetical protein [Lachnospiraceae bacterium]
MKFTVNQEKLLNALLDRYERSKTHEGTNLVPQNFAVDPIVIWSEYVSDFADVEQVKDFETEMRYLESIGLITIREKDGAIAKLVACSEKLTDYYDLLQRKRKKDVIQEQIAFFEEWGKNGKTLITSFCNEQLERIGAGKKPIYTVEVCEKVLQILNFILENKEELLERELSILLLADSKVFEEKYRNKICKMLCTYMDFSEKLVGIDDVREQEKVILEEFNIYTNPSYVYLKGMITMDFEDEKIIRIDSAPVALSSNLLKKLTRITVETENIVTVENLTSFHRVNDDNCTYIYLAGYHNSEKQALLRRINKENPQKKWYHFGDIDPDGFYILEHLRKGTGIDFEPLYMSVLDLMKYTQYCKELTDKDKVKADNLIVKGKYVETLQYMLNNNCKLEQEIISISR